MSIKKKTKKQKGKQKHTKRGILTANKWSDLYRRN